MTRSKCSIQDDHSVYLRHICPPGNNAESRKHYLATFKWAAAAIQRYYVKQRPVGFTGRALHKSVFHSSGTTATRQFVPITL